jgi:hypothetical protein
MERRRVLALCGTVTTGLLAGCSGGGGDGEDGGGDETTAEPTATATAEPTATATAEPTATATAEPTATAGFDGPTHELGDSFTVGSGSDEIGYRITDLFRTDEVGGSANSATADGTFLIVVLELSNPQDDATSFPTNRFLVANDEQLLYLDDDATPKLADDDRIDVTPLGNATVLGGNSKTGAVVFDVDPDRSYHIRIRPTGESGETHYLPIGPIADVQELQSSITG